MMTIDHKTVLDPMNEEHAPYVARNELKRTLDALDMLFGWLNRGERTEDDLIPKDGTPLTRADIVGALPFLSVIGRALSRFPAHVAECMWLQQLRLSRTGVASGRACLTSVGDGRVGG